MDYRLLAEFKGLFDEKKYIHRDSSRGDWVAHHLYEDLQTLGKSKLLVERIASHEHVLNVQNRRRGIDARRGDGTFGELIPGITAITDPGFAVARGPIANVEIGVEVKILSKAMIKQIGRVKSDLEKQVAEFNRGAGTPICVAIVGINYADYTVSYEGERSYRTDGGRYLHPIQEAAEAEARLVSETKPKFDEFVFLRYKASNEPPFPFEWVNYIETFQDYSAALTRISREYDTRFGP
jgi:hypothetical protein